MYGEPEIFPTPETAPFPVQTSLYAASKLAAEGMIAAYVAAFGYQAYIFRFVSILGERYTHGHVFDFYKKLLANPHEIEVLGNGQQRKSYLYVQDCLSAMLTVIAKAGDAVNVFNLGADTLKTVLQQHGSAVAFLQMAIDIARHHHERHDGSGYPDGLRGAEIPLTAQILQLTDVFDALTTDRPYRNASPVADALDIMDEEAARGWWNRELFAAFREMILNGNSRGHAAGK